MNELVKQAHALQTNLRLHPNAVFTKHTSMQHPDPRSQRLCLCIMFVDEYKVGPTVTTTCCHALVVLVLMRDDKKRVHAEYNCVAYALQSLIFILKQPIFQHLPNQPHSA